MAAKGATSSLSKGRRDLYRVTATSLLVAAAMLLLRFDRDSVSPGESLTTAVFYTCERPEHVKRCRVDGGDAQQLACL